MRSQRCIAQQVTGWLLIDPLPTADCSHSPDAQLAQPRATPTRFLFSDMGDPWRRARCRQVDSVSCQQGIACCPDVGWIGRPPDNWLSSAGRDPINQQTIQVSLIIVVLCVLRLRIKGLLCGSRSPLRCWLSSGGHQIGITTHRPLPQNPPLGEAVDSWLPAGVAFFTQDPF